MPTNKNKHNFKKVKKSLTIITVLMCIMALSSCTLYPSQPDAKTVPTDDEITAVYQKAVEAFGWFYMDSGVLLGSNETKKYDGQQYSRVVHEDFHTLTDLKSYLKSLFSDEIVEKLLEGDGQTIQFRDIDGALYCIDAARGSNLFRGAETYSILPQGNDKYIFRVTVEILSDFDNQGRQTVKGYETNDFIYEKINGKWVFSTFKLVR